MQSKTSRSGAIGLTRRNALTAFGALSIPLAAPALAQTAPLRVGVLTDMSGIFADMTGPGSLYSARRAASDHGGRVGGRRIEILQGDHQNKPDIASALARQWYSADGVDIIVNAAGSAVALAVAEITRLANKTLLVTGALSSQLTGASCTPNTVHYGADTYALANTAVSALSKRGLKTWFFITPDYAFGHAMQADATSFIERNGGKVLGSVLHPLNTGDFSSYLLQAQSSGAQVVVLGSGGSDIVNAIQQAHEFGMTGGSQLFTALSLMVTDIHAAGPERAADLVMADVFYWNMDDRTRAFAVPFNEAVGHMPTFYQAADYSALRLALQTAEQVDPARGAGLVAALKGRPIDDFFARGGQIRPDGLLVHDLFLTRVKKAAEMTGPWDVCSILSTIPGDDAFRPLAQSKCPLIKA